MKVKIEIDNSYSYLVDADQNCMMIVSQKLTFLNKNIQYEIKNLLELRQHAIYVGRRYDKYDLKIAELQPKVHTKLLDADGGFPTGLLKLVTDELKFRGFDVECRDLRRRPQQSVWLKDCCDLPPLRYYQKEMVDVCVRDGRGTIEACTASGKSLVITTLIKEIGVRSLVVVPSINLLNQMCDALTLRFGAKHVGGIGDGRNKAKALRKDIIVATPQTLVKMEPSNFEGIDCMMLDECFSGNTKIVTNAGVKKFRELFCEGIDGLSALSFNEDTKVFEFKKILKIFRKEAPKVLLRTEIGVGAVVSTSDHKILTENGWKSIGDVDSDEIVIAMPRQEKMKSKNINRDFSATQKQIILGSILGDGSISVSKKNTSARISFTCSDKRREYFDFKCSFFPESEKINSVQNNFYGEKSILRCTLKSRASMVRFKKQGVEFNPHLFNQLNELGLAIWYCDDGSLHYDSYARLNTQSYGYECNLKISKFLFEKFGLKSDVRSEKKKARNKEYFFLSFNRKDTEILCQMVAKFIVPCMRYKLIPSLRNGVFCPPKREEMQNFGSLLIQSKSDFDNTKKKNRDNRSSSYVYDITVEDNHNYVLDCGVIAHNCHHSSAETFQTLNRHHFKNIYHRYCFSGTAFRNDGSDLALIGVIADITYRYPAIQAIKDGFVAKPRFFIVDNYLAEKFKKIDPRFYASHYKKYIKLNANRNHLICRETYRLAEVGRHVVVICNHVEHVEILQRMMPWVVVTHGKTKDNDDIIERFNRREFPVLIGTEVIGEGVDTIGADAVILAAGGKAKSTVIQRIGRALRLREGKTDCIIVDFADKNISTFQAQAKSRQKIFKEEYQEEPVLLQA